MPETIAAEPSVGWTNDGPWEHTVDIFRKHLEKIAIYDRPLHNFIDEDKNQMIAHYRHNNEWKTQSELNILDEIHGEEKKNKDTLVSLRLIFNTSAPPSSTSTSTSMFSISFSLFLVTR